MWSSKSAKSGKSQRNFSNFSNRTFCDVSVGGRNDKSNVTLLWEERYVTRQKRLRGRIWKNETTNRRTYVQHELQQQWREPGDPFLEGTGN